MMTWQFEDDLGVCHVRVSQRGKTQIKLRVRERHLIEISAPKHLSAKRIQTFSCRAPTLGSTSNAAQLTHITEPEHIWYQGQRLPIIMRPVNTAISFQSRCCVLSSTPSLSLTKPSCNICKPKPKATVAALKTWLPTQHADLDVRLSSARSYWGICRPQQIKLNWRLIGAPQAVLDYVCVHEICHLRHPNHSAAFWQAVAEHMPDYRPPFVAQTTWF
jgi:predicted metal-dependent hydrolase